MSMTHRLLRSLTLVLGILLAGLAAGGEPQLRLKGSDSNYRGLQLLAGARHPAGWSGLQPFEPGGGL